MATVVQAEAPRSCGCLRQLPSDMFLAAGKSALYSFTAGTILSGGNVLLGLCSAAVSAAASLIDSLIRPLLNLCFSRAERGESCYFWTKLIVGAIITAVGFGIVAMQLGLALEVSALASTATFLFLSLFPSSGVVPRDHRHAPVLTLLFV